jgi:hypothetical protein
VFRGEKEVDMVGHQHVGVEVAMLALQGLAQPAKVGVAILLIEEASPAIEGTGSDPFFRL